MPYRSITVGDVVPLDGGQYAVVEIYGTSIKLREVGTSEYRVVSLDELSEALGPITVDTPPPGELDLIPKAQEKELQVLADHIEEMLTGIHPRRPGVFNPTYRPNLPLGDREKCKSEELTLMGLPISARSLRRKRSAYAPAPGVRSLAGLLDKRSIHVRNPFAAIPNEFIDAIHEVIREEADETTRTNRPHRARVLHWLKELHPDVEMSMPTPKTLRKWIGIVAAGTHLDGTATLRNSVSKRGTWVFNSRPAIMPGHEVQVDSSKFDILVRDEHNNVYRATLVAMIDKRTRSVVASGVYETNKGVDLALLLARALSPRKARRPEQHFKHADLPTMPWAEGLSPEEREEYDDRVPFIYPQRLIMDNGADWRSKVFMSACERFAVDVSIAPPGSPTWKAIVENFFAIVAIIFAERVPGYIGRDTTHRGRKAPDPETLLTIDQLDALWQEFIVVVWQNRIHGGLRDPQDRSRAMTPNKMYLASYPTSAPVRLPITHDDYIDLMPVQFRAIKADGITIATRRYDSPQLISLRGRASGDLRHKNKWAVRYDPYDPSAVWVRDPETLTWIECDWMNQRWLGEPHQEFIRKQIQQVHKAVPALNNDSASDMVAEAIRNLTTNANHSKKLQRRKKRALEVRTSNGAPALRRKKVTPAPKPTTNPDDGDNYVPMRAFDPKGDF